MGLLVKDNKRRDPHAAAMVLFEPLGPPCRPADRPQVTVDMAQVGAAVDNLAAPGSVSVSQAAATAGGP